MLKSALHRPSAKLWKSVGRTDLINQCGILESSQIPQEALHNPNQTSKKRSPVHQQTLYNNMNARAIWVTLRHGLPRSANDFLPGTTVEPGPIIMPNHDR